MLRILSSSRTLQIKYALPLCLCLNVCAQCTQMDGMKKNLCRKDARQREKKKPTATAPIAAAAAHNEIKISAQVSENSNNFSYIY